MRHLLWLSFVGTTLSILPASPARAQYVGGVGSFGGGFGVSSSYGATGLNPYGASVAYGAPGNYATTWGVPSFGWPRTYTVFSSPYGPGYGYGYYPYMYMPGYYGYRLWRPGFAVPGYVYGAGYYGTAATPYQPLTNGVTPPIGLYGGGFGAPGFVGW